MDTEKALWKHPGMLMEVSAMSCDALWMLPCCVGDCFLGAIYKLVLILIFFTLVYTVYEPFPKQALVFTCLQYKSSENTVVKGEITRNDQFLLFPQGFLPIWKTFCHFHHICNFHLQTLSVWKSLKLSFGKGLNIFYHLILNQFVQV